MSDQTAIRRFPSNCECLFEEMRRESEAAKRYNRPEPVFCPMLPIGAVEVLVSALRNEQQRLTDEQIRSIEELIESDVESQISPAMSCLCDR